MESGCATWWLCKLQATVALSSCEGEINAVSAVGKEVLWRMELDEDIWGKRRKVVPPVMFEDNQGAIAVFSDNRFSERTKHIATKLFFLKKNIADNTIAMKYCPTEYMIADIFTKPLGRERFAFLRARLGLQDTTVLFPNK